MADLTQTAANVKLQSVGSVTVDVAGEALTQGQPCRLANGKWFRCEAGDDAAKANCGGLVLTPASTNGRFCRLLPGAEVDLGSTLVVGEVYVVSNNIGAIAPIGDLGTGDFVTPLGVALAADALRFDPQPSGVAKP